MTKDDDDALRCAEKLESWYGPASAEARHLRHLVAENRSTQAELLAARDRAERLSKCAAMLRFGLKEAADAGFQQAKSMRASYLGQDAAEVLAYESALVAKDALLRQIALTAHCGGLASMSEADALIAIRKLTLETFKGIGHLSESAIRQHLEGKA